MSILDENMLKEVRRFNDKRCEKICLSDVKRKTTTQKQ